jgi:hypothetical protein
VPGLDVIGQRDSVFCAPDGVDCSSAESVRRVEAPYYLAAAQLRMVVIPTTGRCGAERVTTLSGPRAPYRRLPRLRLRINVSTGTSGIRTLYMGVQKTACGLLHRSTLMPSRTDF